ncbi:unnamed protein product [Toxocara canis]|uniref:HECT-type E3 ubiquitin transferase n=1 Tax=Toxocara canis TaxID=6265 RepID=A0A183U7L9_TOXCA|nr:unnamed protein product [Toxocara canis]
MLSRSLQAILDYDKDDLAEVFGLTFVISLSLLGYSKEVELKENGAEIAVTQENKAEFVKVGVFYIFITIFILQNTEYKRVYYADHEVIRCFWEVFFEFTLEKRKKFLQFLMGTTRIPLQVHRFDRCFIIAHHFITSIFPYLSKHAVLCRLIHWHGKE